MTETIDIQTLVQDDHNFNKGTDAGRQLMEKSFKELGAGRSILVDKDGRIIAGNKSQQAAIAAGIKKVRIIETTGDELVAVKRTDLSLDSKEGRELALADNLTTQVNLEWDKVELAEVAAQQGIDLPDWGLDPKDFAPDPTEPQEAQEDEFDEEKDAVAPVCQKGDIWLLGQHRLMCGDSTDADAVGRLMGGESAQLLMTDPPYGISAEKMTLGTGKKEFHRGDWDSTRPDISLGIAMTEKQCIWGGNYFADKLPVTNDWLCWHKKNDGLSFSEFELAWTNFGHNCRILSHHWSGEVKLHPTMKPIAVIDWAIKQSDTDGNILDLFGGSGSTLIAAEQLGRKCFMMELDPHYCDVIIARWEKLTGLKAQRL